MANRCEAERLQFADRKIPQLTPTRTPHTLYLAPVVSLDESASMRPARIFPGRETRIQKTQGVRRSDHPDAFLALGFDEFLRGTVSSWSNAFSAGNGVRHGSHY